MSSHDGGPDTGTAEGGRTAATVVASRSAAVGRSTAPPRLAEVAEPEEMESWPKALTKAQLILSKLLIEIGRAHV